MTQTIQAKSKRGPEKKPPDEWLRDCAGVAHGNPSALLKIAKEIDAQLSIGVLP
jgi:hypothetical protein